MVRKTFIIDHINRRYTQRIAPRRAQIIRWPQGATRSPAHLAHMAAFMQKLGYFVTTIGQIPAGATELTVSQAAAALGVRLGTIYYRISTKKLAHTIHIDPATHAKTYRIPVSALQL